MNERRGGYLMNLSAIIVILVLTALSLGALVWMEIQSRKTQRERAPAVKATVGVKRGDAVRSVSKKNGTNEA
jgi:hypothetical protein